MNKTSKRIPLYSRIHEYARDQISNGVWRPGDRLPSENELARQFQVSRITVKQAMSALVKEGMIYRIQGKGSFVSRGEEGEPAVIPPRVQPDFLLNWVAFLMPSLDSSYTTHLLKGVEGALSRAGYRLMFCRTSESPERESRLIAEMVQSGAKGIIIYPAEGESYNEEILRLTLNRYPIVVIDRYLKGVETNCVCSDHFGGAGQATSHLLQLGHKKIAYLTTPYADTSSLEDRLEGYKHALAEAMLPVEKRLIVTDLELPRLVRFFHQNPDVTAVFAANAGIGLKAIDAIEEAGLRIPDQISIVFFDTFEYAAYARVPPTSVVQQEEEIGRQAAELLLSVIEEPSRERQKIILPPKLVLGRSTGAPFKKT